jgi:hypothetical protein
VVYPEQKLTTNEMETGIRELDLSASILKGIRKATVLVEEPKGSADEESEEELSDPMEVQSEETYLQEFDLDKQHHARHGHEGGWRRLAPN